MEEAIIVKSNVQKAPLLSDNGIEASSGCVVDLLKERIVFLENELKQGEFVEVNNIPDGASDVILDKLDDFLKNKLDGLIVHAGTNDITKGGNLPNNVKNILKQVKKLSPNTKVAFSSIVTRKDKKDISKTVQDTNSRLKKLLQPEKYRF